MDGAGGWNRNPGEPADQSFANFASTPAGVLAFHIQDIVLYLKRKLVGVTIVASAAIRESLNTGLLIAIEDLVASLAGNSEFPAQFRHRFAS